jgi:hypothetical protein
VLHLQKLILCARAVQRQQRVCRWMGSQKASASGTRQQGDAQGGVASTILDIAKVSVTD